MFLEALGDAGGLAGIEAAGRLAAQDLDEEHEYLARPETLRRGTPDLLLRRVAAATSIQLSYGRSCKMA